MPIFENAGDHAHRSGPLVRACHDTGTNMVAGFIAKEKGKPGPDQRKFRKKATSFISIGGSDWSTRVSCDMNLVAMCPMWKVIDDLVFQWSKSIILDDDAVAKCHQVGVNIAKACMDIENAEYLGDKGVCGNCHPHTSTFKPTGRQSAKSAVSSGSSFRQKADMSSSLSPNNSSLPIPRSPER